MIPAPHTPYVARYRQENKATASTYYTTKPVVAWDDDGAAQVVDQRTGRLVDASSYSNFASVMEADTVSVVAAIPGGGWLAEYQNDDGTTFTMTIVAWNVRADGSIDAVCTDAGGVNGDPTDDEGFVRLYLPAEEPQDGES